VSQIAKQYLAAATNPDIPAMSELRHIDELARGGRGPHAILPVTPDFAIVDAIDVLLCEGGTARLLGPAHSEDGAAAALIEQASGLADELQEGRDFSRESGTAVLTSPGEVRLGLIGRVLGPPWQLLAFNRQLTLACRALDARSLGDQDYGITDGEVAPLSERAIAAFSAPPDEDPSVKDFLAARTGANRALEFTTRISIGRFARKYRRLGGTIAFSPNVQQELARRFALACAVAHEPTAPRLRLRVLGNRTAADRLLVSEARSAIERRGAMLIVAPRIDQTGVMVQNLTAAKIQSVHLQGPPSEADADLVGEALKRPGSIVVIGPGRDIGGMRKLTLPDGSRPRLFLQGIENFGATPGALAATLPLQEFDRASLAIANWDAESRGGWLSRIERRLFECVTASDGKLAQRLGWRLLRSACARAARRRSHARTMIYRHEDQQIAAVAFVGRASRGL